MSESRFVMLHLPALCIWSADEIHVPNENNLEQSDLYEHLENVRPEVVGYNVVQLIFRQEEYKDTKK